MTTIILVHGAWAGSWIWKKVVGPLENRGHRVLALDLPGNGNDPTAPADVSLTVYAHYLCGAIDSCSGSPVVLVGHSGAGIVISQVAEWRPNKVGHLVFIAGFLLPDGIYFRDFVASHVDVVQGRKTASDLAEYSDDGLTTTIRPESAIDLFFNEADSDEAALASRSLTPQPERGRSVCATLSLAAFGSVKRTYVKCLKDRSILPEIQESMMATWGVQHRRELDTDHAPQLSRPARIVQILDDVALNTY